MIRKFYHSVYDQKGYLDQYSFGSANIMGHRMLLTWFSIGKRRSLGYSFWDNSYPWRNSPLYACKLRQTVMGLLKSCLRNKTYRCFFPCCERPWTWKPITSCNSGLIWLFNCTKAQENTFNVILSKSKHHSTTRQSNISQFSLRVSKQH